MSPKIAVMAVRKVSNGSPRPACRTRQVLMLTMVPPIIIHDSGLLSEVFQIEHLDSLGSELLILKLIQGVVLKAWSESAAVMVCSNVCRGGGSRCGWILQALMWAMVRSTT